MMEHDDKSVCPCCNRYDFNDAHQAHCPFFRPSMTEDALRAEVSRLTAERDEKQLAAALAIVRAEAAESQLSEMRAGIDKHKDFIFRLFDALTGLKWPESGDSFDTEDEWVAEATRLKAAESQLSSLAAALKDVLEILGTCGGWTEDPDAAEAVRSGWAALNTRTKTG